QQKDQSKAELVRIRRRKLCAGGGEFGLERRVGVKARDSGRSDDAAGIDVTRVVHATDDAAPGEIAAAIYDRVGVRWNELGEHERPAETKSSVARWIREAGAQAFVIRDARRDRAVADERAQAAMHEFHRIAGVAGGAAGAIQQARGGGEVRDG